jgi:HEAT repeat protein
MAAANESTSVAAEARKLFEGADYDPAIIGSEDRDTRRLVGAELLSVLVGRNPERRERAREAFMKHGYFDDATRDLRVAESDNERAAAARRLSFVHDREAVPHLIGALGDPAPDVRRASVEALMDLRDPSAIGPLNLCCKLRMIVKSLGPSSSMPLKRVPPVHPSRPLSSRLLKAFLHPPSQLKLNAR